MGTSKVISPAFAQLFAVLSPPSYRVNVGGHRFIRVLQLCDRYGANKSKNGCSPRDRQRKVRKSKERNCETRTERAGGSTQGKDEKKKIRNLPYEPNPTRRVIRFVIITRHEDKASAEEGSGSPAKGKTVGWEDRTASREKKSHMDIKGNKIKTGRGDYLEGTQNRE